MSTVSKEISVKMQTSGWIELSSPSPPPKKGHFAFSVLPFSSATLDYQVQGRFLGLRWFGCLVTPLLDSQQKNSQLTCTSISNTSHITYSMVAGW